MAALGHREQASGTKDPSVAQSNSKKMTTKSYSIESNIQQKKENSFGGVVIKYKYTITRSSNKISNRACEAVVQCCVV